MPAYPLTLPAPLSDGYALDPVEQTIRTDMEAGAARVRRRTRTRNDMLSVSFLFSDAQFLEFRTWFDDETTGISGGASWFDISLPVGKGGSTPETARFKGVWKSAKIGTNWRVSGELEVR
jgi:hypothetical protein